MDLAPKGRDEDQLNFTMSWVRHRDRYDQQYAVDPAATYQPLRAAGSSGSCCHGESGNA